MKSQQSPRKILTYDTKSFEKKRSTSFFLLSWYIRRVTPTISVLLSKLSASCEQAYILD